MMSEPLELKEQTPYAIDRLDTLKAAIMHSIQEMVIHRAKVEKYRKSDLPTARSAYETLEYFRKQLAEQLMESQLILLETEAYKLASTLSPDCCTPDIFLNTFVNLILYCQREVERIEAVEADERNAVAYIGKEAA